MNTNMQKPASEPLASGQSGAHIPFHSQNLRQARLRCHLTIDEAARLAAVNKMTLQRYECGDIRTITLERLNRLAHLYQVPPAWLAGASPRQEFFSEPERLLLSPDQAEPPSHLGTRLLACLRFFLREAETPYSAG